MTVHVDNLSRGSHAKDPLVNFSNAAKRGGRKGICRNIKEDKGLRYCDEEARFRMADVMSIEQRRRVMSRIRGTNTTPERYVNALLLAAGFDFGRHAKNLPGRPDFVFAPERVLVFVDGDFWHGWRFPIWQHRLSSFWREKITKNRLRDRKNFQRLRRDGWKVLRLWEHDIEKNVSACILRIGRVIGKKVNLKAVEERLATLPALKRRNRLPKP